MNCATCKAEIIEGESWQAEDGSICQECWEDETSRSWWQMVNTLGKIPKIGLAQEQNQDTKLTP